MPLKPFRVLLIFLFTVQAAMAQQEVVPIISPTAASLGKFVDIPVNYHTGIPNIDIPIYTVNEGPLQLPVSLSYHAGGLKVGELSGWAGAGWALNAGGVISRTVRGRADERGNPDGYTYLKDHGYFSYLMNGEGLDWNDFANGQKDGEPDLFFFNFGGYSGKFFFREDGEPVFIPQQDFKVEPAIREDGSNFRLQSWKVTTPDGTNYYFGISDAADNIPGAYAVETAGSITRSNQDGCYSRDYSSWYLYKVESADKTYSIKLSYEQEEYGYYTLGLGEIDGISYNALVKNIMRGVRLSKIIFSHGEVGFVAGAAREDLVSDECTLEHRANSRTNAAKALGSIKISNGSFCKEFLLNTGYFVDNTNSLKGELGKLESLANLQVDKKRLKLNSITERTCSGDLIKPATTFSYYEENAVPRSLLLSVDHWGFNNGAVDNQWLVPSLSTDGGINFSSLKGMGQANRESSWPAMRAGTLKEIRHATGGFTEFVYGTDYVQALASAGGGFSWTYEAGSSGCGADTKGGRCPSDPAKYIHTFTIAEGEVYRLEVSSMGANSCEERIYGSGSISVTDKNGSVVDQINIADGKTEYRILNLPKNVPYYLVGQADAKPASDTYPDCTPPYGAGISVNLYKGVPESQEVQTYAVGGLRIEEIKHKESPETQLLSTRYEYPSGVSLFSIPRYIFKVKNHSLAILRLISGGTFLTENGCAYDNINGNMVMRHGVSTSSVHPMQTTQGSHKGYAAVKVISPNNGYSLYEYDISGLPSLPLYGGVSYKYIDASVCGQYEEAFPPVPVEYQFERGNLLLEKHFTNGGALLRETSYKVTYQKDGYGGHGLKVAYVPQISNPLPVEYQTRSAKKISELKIDKVYEPGNGQADPVVVRSETLYNDPFHNLPTVSTSYDGEGATAQKMEETVYTYVKDLDPCAIACTSCADNLTTEINTAFSRYQNFLVLADAGDLSSCNTLQACNDPTEPCTNKNAFKRCAYTNYEWEVNEARKKYAGCLVSCTTGTACLDNAYTGTTDAMYKAVIALNQQNHVQLPLEITYWKNNGLLEAQGFEYTVKDNATKNTYPSRTVKVNSAVPLTPDQFSAIRVSSNAIAMDTKYQQETILRYENGKLVQVTGRDGVSSSFIYKDNLPVVKGMGVGYDDLLIAHTYALNTNHYESEIRNHEKTRNAFISTYTYFPLVGMTSATDPKNLQVSYGYDNLFRLKTIKDHDGNIVQTYEYNYRTP